jgi:hypothetical protein
VGRGVRQKINEIKREELTIPQGAIGKNGKLSSSTDGSVKQIALQIPDAQFRIIPNCCMGDDWYYGLAAPPDPTMSFLVSFGTNIVVQSASLPILSMATGGRMTPQRLWRLAIWQEFFEDSNRNLFDGIDYGEVIEGMGRNIKPTPGISDLKGLEELGDVERIKMAIIHEGKFWVWMRPDRSVPFDISYLTVNAHQARSFPFKSTGSANEPVHIEPPPYDAAHSALELLPFELVSQIANYLPLPSLLSLVSACRQLRFEFLGLPSDRDALVRSWITKNAPWYLPEETLCLGADDVVGWEYIKRCLESGSMRNRKRIWKVAEQLEKMANGIGI